MVENESYSKNWFTPKNIAIYLVIGAVVYGLVYYFFFWNKAGSPYQAPASTTPTTQTTTTTTTTPAWTVTLSSQNGSGQDGVAYFYDQNGKTRVVVQIPTEKAGAIEPAHIHVGACPKPGAIKFPLTDVVNGTSETIVDSTIDAMKSMLPLALNVHESAAKITNYLSCGDLK